MYGNISIRLLKMILLLLQPFKNIVMIISQYWPLIIVMQSKLCRGLVTKHPKANTVHSLGCVQASGRIKCVTDRFVYSDMKLYIPWYVFLPLLLSLVLWNQKVVLGLVHIHFLQCGVRKSWQNVKTKKETFLKWTMQYQYWSGTEEMRSYHASWAQCRSLP